MEPEDENKLAELQRLGCLNPRPEGVKEAYFVEDGFFDPRDLVQVKYEMLRRVNTDEEAVGRTAELFGFSRNAFYEARRLFEREGIAGLNPKKRGPKGGHKITAEVLSRFQQALEDDPSLDSGQLVEFARREFGITVHPRSIERALEKRKKNS